ncbi:protein kinase domain-containing protein [Desulfonema magnum]|uniref:Tetratricopeptide repeat-containing protein n=1 Tax=Desulfonema magnum TaxID=45655 RepID=A0A975BX60_9BACT|nr:protein kinase [Desulfonema magnum]QTA93426.1 Tetratricopeptide repeat-containing protein [Desulfonema magnum]
MIFNTNPYIVGKPVGGTRAFVGRANILQKVLRFIREPYENTMVFYGKKHIGKTSVLQELTVRLPRKGPYVPIYFDLQDKASFSPEQVIRYLTHQILHILDISPSDHLKAFFDSQKAVSDTPGDGDILIKFQKIFLPYVLSRLPEGASLILLFDEFDMLDNFGNEPSVSVLFPYLRNLMTMSPALETKKQTLSDTRRLKFVFTVARRPKDLSRACLSLFRGIKFHHISLLSQKDLSELVYLSKQNASLKWPDELLIQIRHLTGGHACLTQWLCRTIWEKIYDKNPEEVPVVQAKDIEMAVPEALENAKDTLEHLWEGLGLAERVVASALAETGSQTISREEFEKHLRGSGAHILIGDLQNVPKSLKEWDLIEPEGNGYRIRIEMWRQWLIQYKPLARVREEIQKILETSEQLFKAARKFYKSGELEEASPLLQQVVHLDPSQRKAYQMLAEIFLAQGNTDEALKSLESLYKHNPWTARPRLVQALISQTRHKKQETEKLALYEKILELDPRQPEAVSEYKKIYEKQGDMAYENNELYKAMEAYKKIGAKEKAEKVKKRLRLENLYQQALDALKKNKKETAQKLLAKVLSEEPSFREATRYMHMAVTGMDIISFKNPITGFRESSLEKIWPDFKSVSHKFQKWLPSSKLTSEKLGGIGTYKLIRKIASGGMADLFLAVNEKGEFRRTVIIKKVLPHLVENEQFIAMFKQEARLAASLYHPNIVQIIDFYEDQNAIIMEYIRGKNLSEITDVVKTPFSVDQAVFVASQICKGLQHAHFKKHDEQRTWLNIVHRDIKPSNILISFNGEVKITDFGISKANSETMSGVMTMPGEVKGTLAYIAPEQLSEGVKHLDSRGDIYSFGLVFYEILSGKKLRHFIDEVTPIKVYKLIIQNDIVPIIKLRSDIPRELNRIVMKCLESDKESRYQNTQKLNQDLDRLRKSLNMTYDASNLADFMKKYFRDAQKDQGF